MIHSDLILWIRVFPLFSSVAILGGPLDLDCCIGYWTLDIVYCVTPKACVRVAMIEYDRQHNV